MERHAREAAAEESNNEEEVQERRAGLKMAAGGPSGATDGPSLSVPRDASQPDEGGGPASDWEVCDTPCVTTGIL